MRVPQPPTLAAPSLNVMNFLNEAVLWYPAAISFAPGRPAEQFFEVARSGECLARFVAAEAARRELPATTVYDQLGQYQRTNGMIGELLCRFLAQDEQIHVPPTAVMITDGGQEAMTILALGLIDRATDVLLVADPTYIGMTGIATLCGVEMRPIPTGPDSVDLAALVTAVREVRAAGKRPKALYLVPDFSNPLGSSMSLEARHELLALAREHELLLIEDNPYGMFAYDGPPAPTLKSLDREGVVIYLGTFSKILYPGLRLGVLVADQLVDQPGGGRTVTLAEELSKVKSLTSVTTSPLLQGMLGGMLLEHGCSLAAQMQPKLDFYRRNRDVMLGALERHFNADPTLAGRVTWNEPRGGFFITVSLPFAFTEEQLRRCAETYGVICLPISYFALLPGREHQIRLSFSAVTPAQIEEGIARLWRFVHDQVGQAQPLAETVS